MSDPDTGGASAPDANASPEAVATDVAVEKGSEAAPSPAATEGDKPAKPQKSGEQIRIDELTRRLRESERRHERLMRHIEDSRQLPAPQPQQPQQPAKTLRDFNYDQAAFTQHELARITEEATKAAEHKAQKARESEAASARREVWDERFEQFSEEHPEILDGWDSLPITQGMGAALEGSENGPEIGLYLRNNRGVAKELSKMHPYDAAREIGRIEERLVTERKKAAEKPVSKAPPPAPTIDAKTSTERVSTTSPESDKLSDEEWVKAEEARMKRKQRRAGNS
jgi:hypothetical protein